MGDDSKLRPSVVTIVDEVSRLNASEASSLVRALEDRLGVLASPAPSWDDWSCGTRNPPDIFVDLWVEDPGSQRLPLIALLRRRLFLTIKEARDLCDRLPGRLGLEIYRPSAAEWIADLRQIQVAAKYVVARIEMNP